MKKKQACYNCYNMMICELYQKQQAIMHEAFKRHILSAYDLPEAKVESPSVKIWEVIGKGCLYYRPFPKEESEPVKAFQKLLSGGMS